MGLRTVSVCGGKRQITAASAIRSGFIASPSKTT
jgi:hypothetical protein